MRGSMPALSVGGGEAEEKKVEKSAV